VRHDDVMFSFGKADLAKKLEQEKDALLAAYKKIPCPPFGDDIVELGVMDGFRADGKTLVVDLMLPTHALKGRDALEASIVETSKRILGDFEVSLRVKSDVQPVVQQDGGKGTIAGVQNILLVASGKGGVGKSTVASNLAVALAKRGAKVGLLDADIYGPSAPTMFGIADGTRPGTITTESKPMIAPLDRHGVKLMSIGFLVDTSTPMVWRGPMIASAAMQLFKDVVWGELDYLVVDMPPGTGDVQLTISQQVVVAGAVIVSTPQDVALADVVRAKAMFDKVSIPIVGVVENMSYFICDSCNKRHEIFFHGGAKAAALRMHVPFLGEVPLEPGVVKGGDTGEPVVISAPQSQSALAFLALADEVATSMAFSAYQTPDALAGPTLSITGGSISGGDKKPKKGLPVVS
jgi:ATP-binding protein involved in chromosome partitioning